MPITLLDIQKLQSGKFYTRVRVAAQILAAEKLTADKAWETMTPVEKIATGILSRSDFSEIVLRSAMVAREHEELSVTEDGDIPVDDTSIKATVAQVLSSYYSLGD